jgi:hypothetical protein
MRNDMQKKNIKMNPTSQQAVEDVKMNTPGYPLYPAEEDIFTQFKQVENSDPENTSKKKESKKTTKAGKNN